MFKCICKINSSFKKFIMIKIKKCNFNKIFNKIKKLIFNPLSIILFLSIIPIIISFIMFFQTGIIPVKSIPLLFNLEIKEYYLIYDSLLVFIFLFSLFKIIEKIRKEIKKEKDQKIKKYLIFLMVGFGILSLVISWINSVIDSPISLYICLSIPIVLGIIFIIFFKVMETKVSLFLGISAGTGFGLILSFKELIFVFIPLLCLLFYVIFLITIIIQVKIIDLKFK